MRAGYAIRQAAELERRANELCACGHQMGRHFELPRTLPPTTLADLADPTPNPEFRPGHFHCNADGCDCVRVIA